SVGVTGKLAEQLSDQPLTKELREKIASFVSQYDNPAGRAELAKLGLTAEQVDAYLARAKYMAESGKFPHVEPKDVPGTPSVPPKAGGSDSPADLPPETKKTGDVPDDQPPETKKTGEGLGEQPPETKKTGDAPGQHPPETKKTGEGLGDQPPETKK